MPIIKAITLHQPWASAIVLGLKEYETRHWQIYHRGLLAIHAGKTWNLNAEMLAKDFAVHFPACAPLAQPLPFGAVVGIVKVVDCIPTERLVQSFGTDHKISKQERRLGNYAPGRYAWKLEVIELFSEPIPCAGKQGLWNWGRP